MAGINYTNAMQPAENVLAASMMSQTLSCCAERKCLDSISTSNPQLIGLSAFFACKARNNHLVAHVLVQQKRLRHKSPLPHKAT